MRLPSLLFVLLALTACAHRVPRVPGPLGSVGRDARVRPPPTAHPPTAAPVTRHDSRLGDAVADAADHYLKRAPSGFRSDCSGFVCAAFDRAGVDVEGSTRSMWDLAKAAGAVHHRKRPAPGDVAFFDDTYDRNRNGRLDDPLSHVAVVLEVRDDGTVLMAHGGTGRGRTTLTMNLFHPGERHDAEGNVLNDWLRRRRDGDAPGTRYLAGELWRGFASPSAFE